MKEEKQIQTINYLVVPNGQALSPGRVGDAGRNAFPSSIIAMNSDGSRRKVWDMRSSIIPTEIFKHVGNNRLGQRKYFLEPGEQIMLELSVIFGGDMNWYAELKPRSKGAILGIQVKNFFDGVIIDANFRGVPVGLYKNEGNESIEIDSDWSVSSFVFRCRCCKGEGWLEPYLQRVYSLEDLGITDRGEDWNGSSDRLLTKAQQDGLCFENCR